jgi:branched-chain amino acid transport system permease protein
MRGACIVELVFILEQVLNGLLIGAYYLLIALGLSLIFSLGGIVNLAHGAFYAIGAYVTVAVAPHIGFGGALIASPILVALLGLVVERFLLRRFYRGDPILSLLLTFGLAMVAEQTLRMIFGAAPVPFSIPLWLRGQVFIGEFIYSQYRLIILGVAVLCVGALWVLLRRTAFGRVVRAGVQNPDMVAALGISLKPYMTAVVMIAVGLAALAGTMMAPVTGVHPAMGAEILTFAFVVVVIGGLGSFWGVVLAAVVVGVVRGLAAYAFPPATEAAVYLLMVMVLLLRPRGLLGERIQKFE